MRGVISVNPAAQGALLERAADYCNFIRAMAITNGDRAMMRQVIKNAWPGSKLAGIMEKAGVAPGRTDGATWGDELAELRPAANAFAELARGRSVLGRLSGFRKVPFRVRFPRQLSGSLVAWTAEGAPSLVSAPSFDNLLFAESKITGVVVVSSELARFSDPAGQSLIDNDLIAATAEFVDRQFLDPEIAEAGGAPASITNGATAVSATGTTEAALKADITSLVEALQDGGSNLENVALVMTKAQALRIAQMSFGDKLGLNGGELLGIPVVTTTNSGMMDANSPTDDQRIVALDTSLILLADGGVEVSSSGQGTLQMNDSPDSPETASTVMVSLWQNNLFAAKIVRFIRWQRARDGAAAYIVGAGYGG